MGLREKVVGNSRAKSKTHGVLVGVICHALAQRRPEQSIEKPVNTFAARGESCYQQCRLAIYASSDSAATTISSDTMYDVSTI